MSNFTKSIVYSGAVLAVGLVAIFAIYNNMAPTGTNFASLEPASGEATSTIEDGFEGTTNSILDAAADAGEAAGEMAEEATNAALDGASDAGEAISEGAEAATETATDDIDTPTNLFTWTDNL